MSDIKTTEMTKKPGGAVRALYVALIAAVIAFDQLSKWIVMELVMRNSEDGTAVDFFSWIMSAPEKVPYQTFEILPFYNIVMVWNYGVSFGMFNNQSTESSLILVGVAVIITFFLLIWMLGAHSKYVGLALAMAIGGAFGNVIDRMRFGAVIDFIDIHVAGHHWPAFNLADSCIVGGIVFVILHSLFFEKHSSKDQKGHKPDA